MLSQAEARAHVLEGLLIALDNLDAVIELSNRALSHLQFQDPVVQNLSSINRDVALVENRVRRALQGESLEAVSTNQAPAGQPAPGKITLF